MISCYRGRMCLECTRRGASHNVGFKWQQEKLNSIYSYIMDAACAMCNILSLMSSTTLRKGIAWWWWWLLLFFYVLQHYDEEYIVESTTVRGGMAS